MDTHINLERLNDTKEKALPKGVKLIILGGRIIFVRQSMGYVRPVSQEEQAALFEKYCSS